MSLAKCRVLAQQQGTGMTANTRHIEADKEGGNGDAAYLPMLAIFSNTQSDTKRKWGRSVLCVGLIAAMSVGNKDFGQEPELRPDQALAIIERPKSGKVLKRAFAAILQKASAQRLQGLKKESDVGLALAAAWRETLRDAMQVRTSGTDSNPVFARLVGFVDGRLPVDLPEWWTRVVMTGRQSLRGDAYFAMGQNHPFADPKRWPHMPNGVSLNEAKDGFVLRSGNIQLPVPAALIKRAHAK
jgi:hypothetical protein